MVSGFRAQPKSPSFEPLERRLLLSVTTEHPPGLGPEPLADDPLPKWEQYPATAEPGNVFLGWNQLSWHEGQQIAADDWFCDSDDALTGVVWWGSYIGWDDLGEPPVRPDLFHLAVWTDVPAGFDQPFSHPGRVIWEADAYGVDSEFVGWDYDPRTGTYEACYRYQHELPQSEWFEQPGDQGIYWLSIAAGYLMTPEVEYPWGWKTRPRDPDTGAPDAAVEIFSPTGAHVDDLYRMGQPIGEPGVQPWDLAFELLTGSGEIDKWGQPPDPERGMNVLAGPRAPGPTAPYEKFLADDFRCEQSGPVTEIVIWASYLQDVRIDEPLRFNLAFYEDLPASQSPTGYSMPEGPIWNRYLEPVKEEMVGHFEEPFFDPNLNEIVGADWTLWKYTFAIDPADAFYQEAGNIYWLGVHHSFDLNGDGTVDLGDSQLLSQHGWAFGWKSAEGVWNDGAVWTDVSSMGTGGEIQPPEGSWNQLLRPQMEEPFDLAFALRTKGPALPKWSQPPVEYIPDNAFHGWDEPSVYGSPLPIVADDWLCVSPQPVTDVHWWGSFLDWTQPRLPDATFLPEAFHVGIWSDVPADPDQPGSWSRPGEMLHEFIAADVAAQFVGWDFDPRDPMRPPEATFLFEYDIPRDEWFWQAEGQNVYWISIAAMYPGGVAIPAHVWGWKTRPRNPDSPAPDDAVVIFSPEAPQLGSVFEDGGPIYWPTPAESWDTAFVLTTQEIDATEIDVFDLSTADIRLTGPTGPESVALFGISESHVFFEGPEEGDADDDDGNGLDEVETEMVSMDLTGDSSLLGAIHLRVSPGVESPGQMEELADVTEKLDVPPFGPDGTAVDSFFDITFEIELEGGPRLVAAAPIRVLGTISHKPPKRGEALTDPTQTAVMLLDETGQPTGITLVVERLTQNGELDFGDAPDSHLAAGYPTLLIHDGARHVIRGPWLGDASDKPDGETEGQADPNALGDDSDGNDDEDGVYVPPLLIGQTSYVTLHVNDGGTGTGGAFVDAWVDFDGDRIWHPTERIWGGWLGNGLQTIPVMPPAGSVVGQTFARFRISRQGGLEPTGLASDGEVEDHEVLIDELPPNTKWVQMPDATPFGMDIRVDSSDGRLRTLADDFECRFTSSLDVVHLLGSWKFDETGEIKRVHLSVHSDDPVGPDGSDPDNQFSKPDKLLWEDDFLAGEFGEFLYAQLPEWGEWWWDPAMGELLPRGDTQIWRLEIPLRPENPFIQAGSEQRAVIYWLDVQVETEQGEFGLKTRQWPEHYMDDAVWGAGPEQPPIWHELRYPEGHPYHGLERDSIDMAFALTWEEAKLDFGDAPERPYPTTLALDGARHAIVPGGPFMGALIDAEPNGQPDPNALGDDNNGVDDEDGVKVAEPLRPGDPAATVDIDMTHSVGGLLNAWVDFNGNGVWGDPGEQIFTDATLAGGAVNTLTFPVPTDAVPGLTYARFRVSRQAGLSPTGLAQNGEVEDYRLEVQRPGEIHGAKWNDLNGNGEWDAGEPALAGWRIFLDENRNGQPDAGEQSMLTGSDGSYQFTNLPAGTHYVTEVLQAGWQQTHPFGLGPEFQVNTSTAERQEHAAAAMDDAGNFVVVWEDNADDGSWWDIRFQRYAADGTPVGPETLVNSTTPGWQQYPDVAMDAAGNFVITWHNHELTADNKDIYARLYQADGTPVGGEFPVNQYTAGWQWVSSVARDDAGNFVVAWRSADQDGDGDAVVARRYANTGAALGNEFIVNTHTADQQVNPSVAMDEDGDFVVSWTSYDQDGDGGGIYAQRYDRHGVAQGPETPVNTYTADTQRGSSAAMDAAGNYVIAWESYDQDGDGYGIYSQRYSATGAPQGAETPVNTYTVGSQKAPSAAMDHNGDYVVTWGSDGQDGSQSGIFARRYAHDGTPIGGEFQVNATTPYDQFEPDAAMSPVGDFVTAWTDEGHDGDSYGIFARQFAAGVHTVVLAPGQIADKVHFGNRELLDFGDAPDGAGAVGYPTLLINDGARHAHDPDVFLGSRIDLEPNGQPDPFALGDDTYDGSDDEDGVTFLTPLIAGQPALIQVVASVQGKLNAWLDYDGNGSWADAGEQIFTDETVGPGAKTLSIMVPSTARPGQTFARFRFDLKGGLPFTGLAKDGEVEDYLVNILQPTPENTKWVQWPDVTPNGIDIRVDSSDGHLRTLADDFQCTFTSLLTDVHLWGSWLDDQKGEILRVHLSVHSDDPVGDPGSVQDNQYSMPDRLLWEDDFGPDSFQEQLVAVVPEGEFWWDPARQLLVPGGDREVWRIDVKIDPDNAFVQVGTDEKPVIYWLDVQVVTEGGEFGWKTGWWPDHFMDDAVWGAGPEQPPIWQELRYPEGHPYHGLERDSIDMAFALTWEEAKLDFGDAPDGVTAAGYPTLLINDGARHRIVPGYHLGGQAVRVSQESAPGAGDFDSHVLGYVHPRQTTLSAVDYYSYATAFAASFNGSWPVLTSGRSHLFLVNTTDGLGLFVVHDKPQDGSGGRSTMGWELSGDTADELVDDDTGEGLTVDATQTVFTTSHGWADCCTDGYALGSLDGSWTMIGGFTIDPALTGMDEWYVYSEDGSILELALEQGRRVRLEAGANSPLDAEPNGQPEPKALGDDLFDGNDDEDGAWFLGPLTPKTVEVARVLASAPGYVDLWIDFGGDGSWAEAGDQVVSAFPVNAGLNDILFVVPGTVPAGLETFARFRFSSTGGLAYHGPARDGEVEDHLVVFSGVDLGDAPDPYPTLVVDDGARHTIAGPWLGDAAGMPDHETEGQPDLRALGDDTHDGHDDENGVRIPLLVSGKPAEFNVMVSGGGGRVGIWIDLDQDGAWSHPAEQLYNDFLPDGTHTLTLNIPAGTPAGPTYARVRITNDDWSGPDHTGPAPTGYARDGEVEDYLVNILDPMEDNTKWVQWPDLTPTGIDIRVDAADGIVRRVADDFECTFTSLLTDAHLWGSWQGDEKGEIVQLQLQVYSDDPAGPGGTYDDNYHSMPDDLLWTGVFDTDEILQTRVAVVPEGEFWWDPARQILVPAGDHEVWRLDVQIDPNDAFLQKGTDERPVIYWLEVMVETERGEFGWKTRRWPDHFMDDAVWDVGTELPRTWKELRYPPGHPLHGLEDDSIDMAFALTWSEALDWGDAPDDRLVPGYPTLAINNGASHGPGGPWLGDMTDQPDPEFDGQPDPNALGDDNDGNDDEDGVTIPVLVQGLSRNVTVVVNGGPLGPATGGYLEAWIDWDGSQSWDPGEEIYTGWVTTGTQTIPVTAPTTSVLGQTFARFRISSAGGLAPDGPASDGEVEDYEVFIREPEQWVKWSQPPVPARPGDVYYGWNEPSVYAGEQIAADDWVCSGPGAVTDVLWWGSFDGWTGQGEVPAPDFFQLAIWEDVPAGVDEPWSHPGQVVWQYTARDYTFDRVGWDFDPRTGTYEACFRFHQAIEPGMEFEQPNTSEDVIYWLSISAGYDAGPAVDVPFGWKTVPRNVDSIAPDEAVRVFDPTMADVGNMYVSGEPLSFAAGTAEPWDLAFELFMRPASMPKWEQPPNEELPGLHAHDWQDAAGGVIQQITLADDWMCYGGLVTDIHWWGNYELDPLMQEMRGAGIGSFHLSIHENDPIVGMPGPELWSMDVVFSDLVEIDTGMVNLEGSPIYLYEYVLPDPFEQMLDQVYWLDIRANSVDPMDPALWRWQEAGRNELPVLAGAVEQSDFSSWRRIVWATDPPTYSDMAFVITSQTTGLPIVKWEQPPDLQSGLDVLAGPRGDGAGGVWEKFLADDFLCTQSGPIVAIDVWSSYLNDFRIDPGGVSAAQEWFTLAIYADIPADMSPTGYSMPAPDPLWQWHGMPVYEELYAYADELFFDPNLDEIVGQDTQVWKYTFAFAPEDAFDQVEGTVYWLGLHHSLDVNGDGIADEADVQFINEWNWAFGWKTTADHWSDDAVWTDVQTPLGSSGEIDPPADGWRRLIDPRTGESIDLSFSLTTLSSAQPVVKWSQPPERFLPEDAYNGWDAYSVYGSDRQIVADDWLCRTIDPITDVHWWGSYIGWTEPAEPPVLPNAFHFAIWRDVPADPVDPASWSHPGEVVWEHVCENFTAEFVGWDFDPRDPNAAPEATFFFEQDLPEDAWFWQEDGTNVYWLSISAIYDGPAPDEYPWGWKTRPREPNSPAPDDAVRVFDPTAPVLGDVFANGEPIYWPDETQSWDLAFELTTREVDVELDFGDAPELAVAPGYPTTLINDGARHRIDPNVVLGALIDAEPDGQPDPNARGDDNAGVDDEDGVVFTTWLIQGENATVDVTTSAAGKLSAWLDFGDDGSWAQASDQLFHDLDLSAGTTSLTFAVPTSAMPGATIARFRFSTLGGLSYTGYAPDGEVEDHEVTILERPTADLGDAPDSTNTYGVGMTAYPLVPANFPTVYLAGSPPSGPIHWTPNIVFLGHGVSFEDEADVGADLDFIHNIEPTIDLANQDGADDGVLGPLVLNDCDPNNTFQYTVTLPGPVMPPVPTYYANVWFDWNRDGDWNDAINCAPYGLAPEWAVQDQPITLTAAGSYTITTTPFTAWHPGADPAPDPLWMRITISEQQWRPLAAAGSGGAGPAGGYQVGETEDYYVDDYQQLSATPDLPDLQPGYDTGLFSNDDITNLDNSDSSKVLAFDVGGTVPGATVTIYADGMPIGSAVATGATTAVTTNGAHDLIDGAHAITARQKEPGKLESPDSPSLTVHVDTQAPTVTMPDLNPASDTGIRNDDDITQGVLPQFDGTANDPAVNSYASGVAFVAVGDGSSSVSDLTPPFYTVILPTMAEGTRSVDAYVEDVAGNSSYAPTSLFVLVDRTSPRVTDLMVRGNGWSGIYLSYLDSAGLGDATYGYRIPVGSSAQLDPLPWGTLDRISIEADDHFVAGATDFTVTGSSSYTVAGYTYSPADRTGTWALSAYMPADSVQLRLVDTVTDVAGNALDGEWFDTTSTYPSGNGVPGGDFVFGMKVLPGDVNQDGVVNWLDYYYIKKNYGQSGGGVWLGDLDGDGDLDFDDYHIGRENFGLSVPAGGVEVLGADESAGQQAAATAPPVEPAAEPVRAARPDGLPADLRSAVDCLRRARMAEFAFGGGDGDADGDAAGTVTPADVVSGDALRPRRRAVRTIILPASTVPAPTILTATGQADASPLLGQDLPDVLAGTRFLRLPLGR